jgi:hypothetical protein
MKITHCEQQYLGFNEDTGHQAGGKWCSATHTNHSSSCGEHSCLTAHLEDGVRWQLESRQPPATAGQGLILGQNELEAEAEVEVKVEAKVVHGQSK